MTHHSSVAGQKITHKGRPVVANWPLAICVQGGSLWPYFFTSNDQPLYSSQGAASLYPFECLILIRPAVVGIISFNLEWCKYDVGAVKSKLRCCSDIECLGKLGLWCIYLPRGVVPISMAASMGIYPHHRKGAAANCIIMCCMGTRNVFVTMRP